MTHVQLRQGITMTEAERQRIIDELTDERKRLLARVQEIENEVEYIWWLIDRMTERERQIIIDDLTDERQRLLARVQEIENEVEHYSKGEGLAEGDQVLSMDS